MGRNAGQDALRHGGTRRKKLIEAAVNAAVKGTRLPPDLQLHNLCEGYSALPDEGGMLDQDAGLVTRMTVLSNIHHAVKRWQNAQGKAVHNLTDSERRILRYLKDEGLMFNG